MNFKLVKLGDFIKQIRGVSYKKSDIYTNLNEKSIELLRANNIKDSNLVLDDIVYVDRSKVKKEQILKKGDILICTSSGSKHLVGKSVLIKENTNFTFGAFCKVIRTEKISSRFLEYFFQSQEYRNLINQVVSGTNINNIKNEHIDNIMISLPPINEQQRIVNRIESLFVKLDRAKELIENTLAQFEQNKMAILHKAFTGELTAKWRKENNIDLSSWEIVSIKDIGEVKGGKRLPKGEMLVNENTGHPYIKAGNLKNGTVAFNDLQYLKPQVYEKIKKYIVKENDVYITIVGACIGDVGIIPKEVNGANLTENAAKITNLKCNAKFLSIQLSISSVQKQIKGKIASATLGKLSLQNIKNIQIKMPTIEEQQEIVNILDKLLAKYNKIKNLEQQLEKIELLKKAILAKAFRGELGTNNPDEESAENLLKEILAEK